VVNVREGKNLRRQFLAFLLSTFGKRVLVKELAKTVHAIESRNNDAGPVQSRATVTVPRPNRLPGGGSVFS
jgi:hypothetical protein